MWNYSKRLFQTSGKPSSARRSTHCHDTSPTAHAWIGTRLWNTKRRGGSTWTDHQLEAPMCPSCVMSKLILHNFQTPSIFIQFERNLDFLVMSTTKVLALPLAQYVFAYLPSLTKDNTWRHVYNHRSGTPFVLLYWDFFLLLPQQRRCRCLQNQVVNTCQIIMFVPTCFQSEEYALSARKSLEDLKELEAGLIESKSWQQ